MASGVSAGDNGAGFLPAGALLLSCGTVLAGIQVPAAERAQLRRSLDELGYPYWDESDNPAYHSFLSGDGMKLNEHSAGPL